MIKVQIITFHKELNYGAALQAYALQKAVKTEGGEAFFQDVDLKAFLPVSQRSLKTKLVALLSSFVNSSKSMNFKRFVKKEFAIVNTHPTDCNLVICGSDQIWNPNITNGFQPYYFGVGLDCNKKISYAASCGQVSTVFDHADDLKKLLMGFSAISVREEQLCDHLKRLGFKSETVVDPTLLIKKDDWVELANKARTCKLPEQYIFVYDLEGTPEFAEYVNMITKYTHIPVVTLRHRPHYQNEIKRFPNASPYEFLKLVKNADYVVSNSYHAMLFSYIFNKKAYIVPHTKYSERMVSFLDKLNIALRDKSYTYVDFSIADTSNMDEWVKKSLAFLQEAMVLE